MKAVLNPTSRLMVILSLVAVLTAAILLSGKPAASSSSAARGRVTVHSAGRTNPFVILKDGHQLAANYGTPRGSGGSTDFQPASLSVAMDQATPLAMQSGDFNADGFSDLVCGYANGTQGVITVHHADPKAFSPTDPDVLKGISEGVFPEPFLADASVLALPEPPNFLGTGDFDRDGNADLVAASQGGSAVYFLAGDGHGGFLPAQRIEVSGMITALITGDINSADGLSDLIVGAVTQDGPKVLVFDGSKSVLGSTPSAYRIPDAAKSFSIGRLDDDRLYDLAILAGNQIVILHGHDTDGSSAPGLFTDPKAGRVERVEMPFGVKSITVGDFIWDRRGRSEIAAVGEDGIVRILSRGEQDTRPPTAEEVLAKRALMAEYRKGKRALADLQPSTFDSTSKWEVAETLSTLGPISDSSTASLLATTRISTLPSSDLVVMNPQSHQVEVLYREASRPGEQSLSAQSAQPVDRSVVNLDTDDEPIGVLPMRLNIDARPGLVVMSKGRSAPAIIVPLAAMTFTVTRNDDPNPNSCATGNCSLRSAVIAANSNPGADTILFAAGTNGTPIQLSRTGDDNTASNGDLDINDDLTITGNGEANTIIQGATDANFTTNMGDKAFGINQDGTHSTLNVSISSLTIRFTKNTLPVSGSFTQTGGAMDIFLTGTGAMPGPTTTLSNVTFANNADQNSYGGGLNIDSGDLAAGTNIFRGTVTASTCTFSNNRTELAQAGGGVSCRADKHNVSFLGCSFSGNRTGGPTSSAAGAGGAALVLHSFGGTVTFNGCSVSGNTAGGVGGGLALSGPANETIVISGGSISNNTSNGAGGTSQGGGIEWAVNVGSLSITNATISGNSATVGAGAQGGGIFSGSLATVPLTITTCTIDSNHSSKGGGIATNDGPVTMTGGSLTNNTASGSGGALYYGGPANVTLSKVTVTGNSATTSGGGFQINADNAGAGTFNMSLSRIVNNTSPSGSALNRTGNTATVQNNWWGTNDPSTPATRITGTANFTPFLKLTHTANPSTILRGCATTLTASFLVKSDNTTIAASNLDVLIGLPITFNNAVKGTLSGAQTTIQASATATATFTAGATGGLGGADAIVDSTTVTAPITINEPPAITCPANIVKSTDPNLCTAVTTFSPTTTGFPVPTVTCVPASGTAFAKGVTTVTCTASNGIHTDATCVSAGTAPDPMCSFTVTVNDTQPPAITCPANITKANDPGLCSAVVTYTTPTPTDNCPGSTAACTPLSGTIFPKGVTTVTCTATDASSNTSNCSFTITVNDTQAPTLTCPANITGTTAPGTCAAIATFTTPTASDNCPGATVACVPASGTSFPKGVTTVTCTATDASSNTANCTFTVTINDNQPPAITCPANITTPAAPGVCQAAVTFTASATDNCPGVTSACTPASGFTFPKGTTTVTCTATDTSSNMTSCSFTVTVVDTQPPTLTCPANITRNNDPGVCTAVVTYAAPVAADNCPGVGTPVCTPASGSTFAHGTTTVSCAVMDASGNSNACSFTVTVNDNQGPTLTCPASNGVFAASSNCLPPANSAYTGTFTSTYNAGAQSVANPILFHFSACDAPPTVIGTSTTKTVNALLRGNLTINPSPSAPFQAPVTMTVLTTLSSQSGSTSTFATEVLQLDVSGGNLPANVKLRESPTLQSTGQTKIITLSSGFRVDSFFDVFTELSTDGGVNWSPANISWHIAAVQTTDANVCTAVVSYPDPVVTDNCAVSGTPVCTPASGTTFAKGVTTVTCTVQDTTGNPGTCSFTITIVDAQLPAITCPANISTLESSLGSGSATVTYTTPTPTDNCPSPTASCSPASGTVFVVGTTTVTCTATDGSGNTASCSFTITVVPQCGLTCPANITTSTDPNLCSAAVNYPSPTTVGACGTVTCSPAAGSAFPKGVTTVTCTSTAGPTCSFTVTVNDTQAPSVTCPPSISVSTGVGCATVTYTTPTGSDNCPGVTVACAPVSGTCFATGTTTVTCTATDTSANTATCTFTVTVTPCTITCPANITTSNTTGQCSATVNYSAPTTTGSCGTVTCTPASGSSFPVGTTTVSCTTGAGPTCSFTVTVNDTQPPTITCPPNQTHGTDTGQCSAVVSYPAPTASDNCPGVSSACVPPAGSTFPKGVTTVTCTATDAAALTATCSFTVTVNDMQAPTITCPANITASTASGQCSAVVTYAAPAVSDNCPGVGTPSCTPASGSTFTKGTTTVTCTVSDSSANSSNCSFTVTVNDTVPPSITCPANISLPTAPNVCTAVATFTTTASDNCGPVTVVCAPASGSTFPKGVTTVTCTATDTSTNTATCSFTVTVIDMQAPTIVCPPPQVAPPGPLNYPPPTVTDNCPGATAVCNPPSGSTFPMGFTTVTCTATDASGNTASCSFVVSTFDIAITDDSGGGSAFLNSMTGDYMICCGGTIISGKGTLTKVGCILKVVHNPATKRVTITVDLCQKKGTAVVQMPPGVPLCTITDKDITNSTVSLSSCSGT